ncbi:hypothetical protein K439DRAFT_1636409 [Ramaria rubella]|nr:hypothetical protein K439DRAFT_1636409 [Ramaria rubella]
MQNFSLIALLTSLAGVTLASPMSLHQIRDCDVASCAVALGPLAVGCGSAVVQLGADPLSDIGCLTSGLSTLTNIPAPCTSCASELGITGAVSDAENAVGGAVNDVTSALGSIF